MSADESSDYLTTQLLTYLGNKRALLPFLGAGVEIAKKSLGKERLTFFDAFSGSGITGRQVLTWLGFLPASLTAKCFR